MVTLCDRRGRFSNLIFDSNVLISSHRWCPCGLVWVLAMAGRAYLLRSLHRRAYGLQIWDAVLSAERSDRGSTGRSTGEAWGVPNRQSGLLGRGCVNVLGLAGARHAVRPKRGASGALSVQVGALGCGSRSSLRKALNGGDESTLQVR